MTHSIRSEQVPAGYVIAVSGDADASASGALDDAVREAVRVVLAESGNRLILIDLSRANFVDSRTIGVLVGWVGELGSHGWRLPIVCSDPNMLRLFRLIGLEQTFDFFDTREAAAASGTATELSDESTPPA